MSEQEKNRPERAQNIVGEILRVPTSHERAEIRVFTVSGPTGTEPDLCLQVYRRVGHEIASPWGPTGNIVRVPLRFAERLIEVVQHVVTTTREQAP